MTTKMLGIIIDTGTDMLISRRDGMVCNGLSASTEKRRAADGAEYTAFITHPDGRVRIEIEVDGIRWTRYPDGDIEGVRLTDGAPVDYAASMLGRRKSARKAAASRANGRKGGRPRRSASGEQGKA